MQFNLTDERVSGHVYLREGKRNAVYYLRYRLPDGRHVKRRLGFAWTERGRAPAGYFTRRMAEERLQAILTDARRGTLAGMRTTGAKFADASAEWLRYVEHDRDVKPSTLSDYKHMVKRLDRTFGEIPLERVGADAIEHWRAGLSCLQPHQPEVPDRAKRDLQACDEGLQAAFEPDEPGRAPARATSKRDRRAIRDRGARPREGGAQRAVRDAVLDGSVHRAAHGRAAGPALGRGGLRSRDDPRRAQLHARRREQSQVGQGTLCSYGRRCRHRACAPRPTRALHRRCRSCIRRCHRRTPRLQRDPQCLPQRSRQCEPAPVALSRSAPHLRHKSRRKRPSRFSS